MNEIQERVLTSGMNLEHCLESLIRGLVLFGDCTGIAHIARDGGGLVLTRWFRSEIELSLNDEPSSKHRKVQAFELADLLEFSLLALQREERWKHLFREPHPSKNRLIHFQLSISQCTAYQMLAAKLHRGICAKTIQLRHLDTAIFNARLGNYTRVLARIVNAFPDSEVRASLHDFEEGVMDAIIWRIVNSLSRQTIGLDGRKSYTTKTLMWFFSTWISAFYGTAAARRYIQKRSKSRRPTSIYPLDIARPDELSSSHALRKSFHDLMAEQNQLEVADLNSSDTDHLRLNTHFHNRSRGMSNISPAKIPVIFVPSRTLTGALPLTSIALIFQGLERLNEGCTESEGLTSRILIELMLHTGRPPHWLISLIVRSRPNSVHECNKPILSLDGRQIFHVPPMYVSPPGRLLTFTNEGDNESLGEDNHIYETVKWIHQVPLPDQISDLLNKYLNCRRQLIGRYPEAAARLGSLGESGPLFIIEKEQHLVLFDMERLERLFELLSAHANEKVPGHPDFRATHFSRSFEGYYESVGLGQIYQYYISGRLRRRSEMPLRYSRVSALDLAEKYFRAYDEFTNEIALEKRIIGVWQTSYSLDSTNEIKQDDQAMERFHGIYFGSTRVASLDVIRDIVKTLTEEQANWQRSGLDLDQHKHYLNATANLIVVMVGLLSGLRPFEITRLRRNHLDLENNRLAIIGKARGKRPAFRHLHIHPIVNKKFKEMLDQAGMEVSSGAFLFHLSSDKSNKRTRLTTADLDQILADAASMAGWSSAPIFYGLRHRFRTDMLKLGVDESTINFLMGHEMVGQEPYSIYVEMSLGRIEQEYRRAASELADWYGFTDGKEI